MMQASLAIILVHPQVSHHLGVETKVVYKLLPLLKH